MLLTKWRGPFANDMFESFFSSYDIMNCDIYEKEGNVVIEAEMPGVNSSDIEVLLNKNTLTISGSSSIKDSDRSNYWRIERCNSFSRSFNLSFSVDPDSIQALYNNGILTVLIPRKSESSLHRVEVKS